MDYELLHNLGNFIIYITIPGGAGGLASFLYAFKKGHYRNNKYVSKFIIELLGSMLTASFILSTIGYKIYTPIIAFCVGLTWSNIIQLIRKKITKLVLAVLSESHIQG